MFHAPSETDLRASYGEGFKLPSFTSLGDPLIGNPTLGPETSRGWDVGATQRFDSGRYELGLTYFHNTFSNLIDLDPGLARQGTFRLVNLSKVITQGIEMAFQVRPIPEILAKSYFTYLESDIKGSRDSLRNRPEIAGGVILDVYPTPKFTLLGNIRAVGKRFDLQIPTTEDTVAGYVKADLTVTFSPSTAWQLFGVLENLTDRRYEEFLGFPATGINFRVGIKYAN